MYLPPREPFEIFVGRTLYALRGDIATYFDGIAKVKIDKVSRLLKTGGRHYIQMRPADPSDSVTREFCRPYRRGRVSPLSFSGLVFFTTKTEAVSTLRSWRMNPLMKPSKTNF